MQNQRQTQTLKFYYIFNSSFTKFFNLDGIVLYPFVFISTSKENTPSQIIKHELIHVMQIRRENSPFLFYLKYMYFIICSLIFTQGVLYNAYYMNKYEVEAYENEDKPLTKEEIKEIE